MSLASSAPSCLPAFENGGQGTPPATRSMPRKALASNSDKSPSMTFHLGRFKRNVLQAAASISTKASCSKPERSKPWACPPAPAQSSREFIVNPGNCIYLQLNYRFVWRLNATFIRDHIFSNPERLNILGQLPVLVAPPPGRTDASGGCCWVGRRCGEGSR